MGKHCQLGCSIAQELIATRLLALRGLTDSAREQHPDAIHDMRVASRRLRAALAEHRGALPPSERKMLQHRARRITRGLSKARELDVTLQRIAELRAACLPECLPLVDQLTKQLQSERARESVAVSQCVELAESSAFATTGDLLQSGISPMKSCYVETAQARLRKRAQAVRTQYKTWLESKSDDDLHAVRIAFKKLRYACEAHVAAYGAALDEAVEAVKRAQTALGEWNDFRIVRDCATRLMAPPLLTDASTWEAFRHLLDHAVEERAIRFHALADEFFSKPGRKRFATVIRAPGASCCGGRRAKGEDAG